MSRPSDFKKRQNLANLTSKRPTWQPWNGSFLGGTGGRVARFFYSRKPFTIICIFYLSTYSIIVLGAVLQYFFLFTTERAYQAFLNLLQFTSRHKWAWVLHFWGI